MNRRIGKKVNGVLKQGLLYRNQFQIVAAFSPTAGFSRFVYGQHVNVPEYMIGADGRTYRFLVDQVGSVRMVIDTQTGAVIQTIEYDEFGNILSDSNPGFQPFGFAGGLVDHDTGLVHFGAREYDPVIGRWTTKDPIGFRGGSNFYQYCSGDPINLIDPVGLVEGDPEIFDANKQNDQFFNNIDNGVYGRPDDDDSTYFDFNNGSSINETTCTWDYGTTDQFESETQPGYVDFNISYGTKVGLM